MGIYLLGSLLHHGSRCGIERCRAYFFACTVVLRIVIEEFMARHNLDDRKRDLRFSVEVDGTGNLTSDNSLLCKNSRAVLEGIVHGLVEILGSLDLGHAET